MTTAPPPVRAALRDRRVPAFTGGPLSHYTARHRDTTRAGRRRMQLREQLAMLLGQYDTPPGRHAA